MIRPNFLRKQANSNKILQIKQILFVLNPIKRVNSRLSTVPILLLSRGEGTRNCKFCRLSGGGIVWGPGLEWAAGQNLREAGDVHLSWATWGTVSHKKQVMKTVYHCLFKSHISYSIILCAACHLITPNKNYNMA